MDEEAAKASPFGSLIASGWHTCSVMMGLVVRGQLRDSTSMGSPGVDEIRWIKPVHAGDTLRMKSSVLDKRVSERHPNRGIVSIQWEGFNQKGEAVIIVRSKAMFGLRGPRGAL